MTPRAGEAGQDMPTKNTFIYSNPADAAAFEAALAGVAWFLPRHTVVSVLPPDAVAGLERVFVPLLG